MVIALASPGFNDLGRSVTPTFLCRNRFYLQLSPHCLKLNKKINVGSSKKLKISVRGTDQILPSRSCKARELWLLNTNLFVKEPHQLTKFT